MAAPALDALADPLGVVVDLITVIEAGLTRAHVQDVVAGVSGGRAKRRRLAQALLQRPTLLTDGRSPAPRVVGDLLIALRDAGAVSISAPRCTDCDKQLRTLQRRGEDWYCGVCGPTREPCTNCRQSRRIACRDRAGRPLCRGCRPDDDLDPMVIMREVISGIDPLIDAADAERRGGLVKPTASTSPSTTSAAYINEPTAAPPAPLPNLGCLVRSTTLEALRPVTPSARGPDVRRPAFPQAVWRPPYRAFQRRLYGDHIAAN